MLDACHAAAAQPLWLPHSSQCCPAQAQLAEALAAEAAMMESTVAELDAELGELQHWAEEETQPAPTLFACDQGLEGLSSPWCGYQT